MFPPDFDEWMASRRAIFDSYATSYARHLLDRYGATEVTLYGIERFVPTPADVRQGKRLGAPEFSREIRLGTYR
jgi:hypothetical protein